MPLQDLLRERESLPSVSQGPAVLKALARPVTVTDPAKKIRTSESHKYRTVCKGTCTVLCRGSCFLSYTAESSLREGNPTETFFIEVSKTLNFIFFATKHHKKIISAHIESNNFIYKTFKNIFLS